MQPQAGNKYQLKDLHQEIDFFDRQIAHLQKYAAFATEEERQKAIDKIATKREKLVKNARALATQGIEYAEAELPRSFKAEQGIVTPARQPEAPPAAPRTDFGMQVLRTEEQLKQQ